MQILGARNMLGNTAALVSLFVGSGLTLLAGTWGIIGEGSAIHLRGGSAVERVVDLATGRASGGLELSTQHANLVDCGTVLLSLFSPEVSTLPEPSRAAILPGCNQYAARLSYDNPTQSFAYFIQATAAALEARWPDFNAQMHLSYVTAPSEQWVAEWRLNFVEAHRAHLDSSLQQWHDADMRVMASTWRGMPALSRLYSADPDFRERLVSLLETMPVSHQRRFINYVRQGTTQP